MPALPPIAAPAPVRRRLPWVFLGLLVLFGWFVAGIVELFQLRFEHGDVYPPYSTLRSDPLGAAAFYESLAREPNLRVERNLRPLDRFGLRPAALFDRAPPTPAATPAAVPLTFFYLGANPYDWPFLMENRAVDRLETVLDGGGRVVITFNPGRTPLTTDRLHRNREEAAGSPSPDISASPSPSPTATPKPLTPRERRLRAETRHADLLDRWGLDFHRIESKKTAHASAPPPGSRHGTFPFPPAPGSAPPTPSPTPTPASVAEARFARPVPGAAVADAPEVPWHTALDFQVDAPAARAAGWHTLYERDGKPVVVARPFGKNGGEILLASDSYFLSNEALRDHLLADSSLLSDLVGGGKHLVFDESHHGVEEQPGLMTLARRYGLQGALAATGLLVALFIWRNVLSLVPPPPPSAETRRGAATVLGGESAAGFLNLVRRGVPPRELLAVCLARWQAGAARRPPDAATVTRLQALADAESARSARDRSPAAVYRAMCAALRPGR